MQVIEKINVCFVIVCATQKTWHTMLTTKFKAERGKMRDETQVLAARAKFGAKRKTAVSEGSTANAAIVLRYKISQ